MEALKNRLATLYSLFESTGLTSEDCAAILREIDSVNGQIADAINNTGPTYWADRALYIVGCWDKARVA